MSDYTISSLTGGRSPTERDVLVIRGIPFDVTCAPPRGSGPIGSPGACLPIQVGDYLHVAYVPLANHTYARAPLRIWVMATAPRQGGITDDTPVRLPGSDSR